MGLWMGRLPPFIALESEEAAVRRRRRR